MNSFCIYLVFLIFFQRYHLDISGFAPATFWPSVDVSLDGMREDGAEAFMMCVHYQISFLSAHILQLPEDYFQ